MSTLSTDRPPAAFVDPLPILPGSTVVIPVGRGHGGRVNSEDLTPEQARRIGAVVGRYLNYLGRLRDRMQRSGFSPDDPLVREVTEAWKATQGLRVRLHYLSCSSGVGQPAKPERVAALEGERENGGA